MPLYQIVSEQDLGSHRRRYPKLDWPIDKLAVGQAFVVPLEDGRDADGRSDAYLRVLADKAGKQLGRKFSCNKVAGGLAITRTA